jgi:hypothetical protein
MMRHTGIRLGVVAGSLVAPRPPEGNLARPTGAWDEIRRQTGHDARGWDSIPDGGVQKCLEIMPQIVDHLTSQLQATKRDRVAMQHAQRSVGHVHRNLVTRIERERKLGREIRPERLQLWAKRFIVGDRYGDATVMASPEDGPGVSRHQRRLVRSADAPNRQLNESGGPSAAKSIPPRQAQVARSSTNALSDAGVDSERLNEFLSTKRKGW